MRLEEFRVNTKVKIWSNHTQKFENGKVVQIFPEVFAVDVQYLKFQKIVLVDSEYLKLEDEC